VANDPVVGAGVTGVGSSLEAQSGSLLTVSGTGTLTLTGASSADTLIVTGGAGATLTTGGVFTVGTLLTFDQGVINGAGSLVSSTTANLGTSGTKTIGLNVTNNGALNWSDGNVAMGTNTLTNAGTFTASGDLDTWTAATITNNGTITKTNAGTETFTADITNSATKTINVSGTGVVVVTNGHPLTQSGIVTIGAGTLNLGTNNYVQSASTGQLSMTNAAAGLTAAAVNISNGTVAAIGTITGAVTVSGGTVDVNTNGTVGTLTITGTYAQSAGTLRLDLTGAGGVAGTNYDLLAVSGAVTLTGSAALNVVTPSYTAADNSAYNVITYASISGAYAVTNDLGGAFTFATDYGASPLTLTVRQPHAIGGTVYADANGNGSLGGGETGRVSGVVVFADANGNGVLDADEMSATTNGSGVYSITGLVAGTYDVVAVVPDNYIQTSADITGQAILTADVTGQDIGLFLEPSITGTVYGDTNSDLTRGADEHGLGAVIVYSTPTPTASLMVLRITRSPMQTATTCFLVSRRVRTRSALAHQVVQHRPLLTLLTL